VRSLFPDACGREPPERFEQLPAFVYLTLFPLREQEKNLKGMLAYPSGGMGRKDLGSYKSAGQLNR
jgi:hypothetical protein